MRKWARANRRKKQGTRCHACSKPVLNHEPDVVLEHVETKQRLIFHEVCQDHAYLMVATGGGQVWHLIYRYVNEELN